MKKVAICVGVNKYDPNYYGAGNDLHMCVIDSDRMDAVAEAHGFTEVYKLQDKTATVAIWKNTLLQQAAALTPGDILLITQSSHGTYQDLPGGKRATAICLQDGIVWDYEVRDILKQFKKGVTVIWMTDCCFSESNWRALNFRVKIDCGGNPRAKTKFVKLPRAVQPQPTQGDKRQIKCNLFVFSSSNIVQPSYEDENGGAFTTAVVEALKAEPNLSYYQLSRRVAALVAQHYPQTPVFEQVNATKLTGKVFLS
jgi:hypothetical protein